MGDDEDRASTEATLADPGALPLDEGLHARMRPDSVADVADIKRRLRGRPRAHGPEHLVSLRLDPGIVAGFQATGPGWQSRINGVLRAHLAKVVE